jgi:hypothetical protein
MKNLSFHLHHQLSPVHAQTMIKVLPITFTSFFVLVGFANATKNHPEMGNKDNRILKQDDAASSLLMISSKELADFGIGGWLSLLVETEIENLSGTTGTKSSKLDSNDAKSKESKSTKSKSAKGKEPEPSSLPLEDPSSLPSEDPSSLLPSEAPSFFPTFDATKPKPMCRCVLREGELPIQELVPLDCT